MATNGHTSNGADLEPEINRMMANARFVNPELTDLPKLYSHCVDDLRPIKVICIGAGLSGILTGIRFPQRIENLDLTIYEKNEDVGGTWWENRYPGVRCDVPSAAYQYTFESNTQWSEYYCVGSEIEDYIRSTAYKYGVYKYIKFRIQYKGATWDEAAGKWLVDLEDLQTGRKWTEDCDFLITATGILNKWKWPEIEGIESYKGKMVHSAAWDPECTLDSMKGKSIALIGAGSSGLQILPQIQPVAGRVDHYMASKTWISPIGFGSEELKVRGAVGNFKHTKEELDRFKNDPEAYPAFRAKIEKLVNSAALITLYGSPLQQNFAAVNRAAMMQKLQKKPEIMEALEPNWPPGCRRLTPGPGYLEALVEDNVDFVSTKIERFTSQGIQTVDGTERKVDLIICATGFDTSLTNEPTVRGRNGVTLKDVWTPDPKSYFGIFPPEMPNMMRFIGPNGASGTGGLIHLLECGAEFMINTIKKAQREYLKSITAKRESVDLFTAHVDEYFAKTIYTQPCRSWMKRGKEDGRVITIWPGSALHAIYAYEHPRWEDFEYTHLDETGQNPFHFLGNGLTKLQERGEHTTDYLDTVDQPPIVNHDSQEWLERTANHGVKIDGV